MKRLLLSTATVLSAVLSFGAAPATAAAEAPSWDQLPLPAKGKLDSVVAYSSTSAFAHTTGKCGPELDRRCTWLWQLKGQTWSEFGLPDGFGAAAVTGTGADDSWFLGGRQNNAGLVYHWDGRNWADRSPGVKGYYVQAAAAVSPTSAWSAGVYNPAYDTRNDQAAAGHWDGTKWTVTKMPMVDGKTASLTAVHASSADDAWAAGSQCKAFEAGNDRCQPYAVHWDGKQWSQVDVPEFAPRSALPTAVISRGSEVWIGGRETDLNAGGKPDRIFVLHYDGRNWTKEYLPVDVSADGFYSNVTGFTFHGTDLLAGVSHTRNEGVVRWNGQTWERYPGPLTTTSTVSTLVGAADGEVLAAGDGTDAQGAHDFLAHLPAPAK